MDIYFFSSDYQQALTMKFISKEDAIKFAEKQGNISNEKKNGG